MAAFGVPQPFAGTLLLRSVWIWLVLRPVVMMGATQLGGLYGTADSPPSSKLELEPVAAVALVVLVAFVATLDARRRNETIFLANLGVTGGRLFACVATLPTVFEVSLAMLV